MRYDSSCSIYTIISLPQNMDDMLNDAKESYESRTDLALRSAIADPTLKSSHDWPLASGLQYNSASVDSVQQSVAASQKLSDRESAPVSEGLGEINSGKDKFSPLSSRPVVTDKRPSAHMDLPDFILRRNSLFDELKKQHDSAILSREKPTISVVLKLGLAKDGSQIPDMPVAAKAWESTPGSFLRHVPKEVSSDVVVAKIDGRELWDLDRPLESSCSVSYLPFTCEEGRNVFWHSSAHVLGEACECQYQCLLSHGPPVEQGFFYDMALAEG